jgi:hypothetical protein
LFTTGQVVEGAVNYTSASAVCGSVVTGHVLTNTTNQTNLTLPVNQACAAPIGAKWVSSVTNWLAFVIDRAGLTFGPGADCQSPLTLYQAIYAMIATQIAAITPVVVPTVFFAQATLPTVSYPCWFTNTGGSTIAMSSPLGPDIIPPGASAFYNGANWSLSNTGSSPIGGYNFESASVTAPGGGSVLVPMNGHTNSSYVSSTDGNLHILASGLYHVVGGMDCSFDASGSSIPQAIFRILQNSAGTVVSGVAYVQSNDLTHTWEETTTNSAIVFLAEGDTLTFRIEANITDVACDNAYLSVTRLCS